jgi:NifU-like protein involved in Fe-S cluster formation
MGKPKRREAMSAETDLIKLYSSRILALAADIPHLERLDAPDATAKKRSPLCGSTVTVDINVADGRVTGFGQDVKACALGQAAASVVGAGIIGCTRAQIETARDQLKAMLKEDGPTPDAPFDGLEVLRPARDYKNRHASILLTLDAAVAAMEQAETTQHA